MKQIEKSRKRKIIVRPEDNADYERGIVRAKVTVDGVEYSAFYDMCNLIVRDESDKVVDLDLVANVYITSELEDYLDEYMGIMDFD